VSGIYRQQITKPDHRENNETGALGCGGPCYFAVTLLRFLRVSALLLLLSPIRIDRRKTFLIRVKQARKRQYFHISWRRMQI